MYRIQAIDKSTKNPLDLFLTNDYELVEYLFFDGQEFLEFEYIGDAMRQCIDMMEKTKYINLLFKVIKYN